MQINDCTVDALGGGQINDLLLTYYQNNGATSGDIDDAEYEFLIANGATPARINDMWFEFLRLFGYQGNLNDMLYQYWCIDGGGVIPPPANVVTHNGEPLTHNGEYVTYGPLP